MPYKKHQDQLEYSRKYRERNRKSLNKKARNYRLSLKKKALEHYGMTCQHCDFAHIGALHIDHVNNDGAEQRRREGNKMFSGAPFYRWLKNNNYPDGYQTLCANCNFIKEWKRVREEQ